MSKPREYTEKIDKLMCTKHGGRPIALDNFYMACPESLFFGIGYIPICKKCLYEILELYLKTHEDIKVAMYFMCRKIDIAFYHTEFESANRGNRKNIVKTFQTYMRLFNSICKTNDKWRPFDYSDYVELERDIGYYGRGKGLDIKFNEDERKEMAIFWGHGLPDEDYAFLNKEYEEWTTRHKCDDYAEEVLYKEICMQMLDIRKDRENGADVTKKVEALQKLMTSANVKPIDTAAIKTSESVNALGLWIKDIEMYRPAEYFDDKKRYVDADGFKKYFDRFIVRPLKNLLTGTRDFDKEFSIENLNDIDG